MIKPFYVTTGHATNSSSSHSVMLLRDHFRKLFPDLKTNDEIGRKDFLDSTGSMIITTKEEKRRYFIGRLAEGMGEVFGGWSGIRLKKNSYDAMKTLMLRRCEDEEREFFWSEFKHEKKDEIRALMDAGFGFVPRSWRTDRSTWDEFDEGEDEHFTEDGRNTRRYEIYCAVPIQMARQFVMNVLPPDDLELNQSIADMLKSEVCKMWDGREIFHCDVGFSNASYSWGEMRLHEMLPMTPDEAQRDIRFAFLRELTAWIERDDIVVITGADDEGTGWNGVSRSEGDEMTGRSEAESVREAGKEGVLRKVFPDWMSSFVWGHPQWGVQSRAERLLSKEGSSNRGSRVLLDPVYGHWTTSSQRSGGYWHEPQVVRARWMISKLQPPSRASIPDVVDLKITNKCPFACAYCYQASTMEGVHAPKEHIFTVLDALGDWGTFELAIGGGEPTLHPDLKEIIAYAMSHGIVPNITTRNKKWLLNPKNAPWIVDALGGVGFSVDKAEDIVSLAREIREVQSDLGQKVMHPYADEHEQYVLELSEMFERWGVNHDVLSHTRSVLDYNQQFLKECIVIHIVMGVMPWEETKTLIDAALDKKFKVLLLDFKQTGFARKQQPYDYSGLVEYMRDYAAKFREHRYNYFEDFAISFDTPLAKRFNEELQEIGYARQSYDTEDGRFSFFIDATTQMAGPSSYCDVSLMRSYRHLDTNVHERLYSIFNTEPAPPQDEALYQQEEAILFD